MKKIIALVISVMMLATLAVGTSAAGEILFTDDFTNGFSPNNWILDGNLYFLDDSDASNPCLAAYSDGVICQAEFREEINGAPRWYTNCSYSIRMQIRDFDKDGNHSVGLWWRDDFGHAPEDQEVDWELGEVYNVSVNVDEMVVNLTSSDLETPIASSPVEGIEVGGDWFTLGWKIVPGHMSVYVNGQKLIDTDIAELSAARPSPFLLMNGNCFAAYDDIVIATVDYDLFGEGLGETPVEPGTDAGDDNTAGGNDNNDDNTAGDNADDKNDGAADDNKPAGDDNADKNDGAADDNKPAGDDKPAGGNNAGNNTPAQTNTNKPAGGNATATGDATFAVIAVMVAVLGCAVAVKKARVR